MLTAKLKASDLREESKRLRCTDVPLQQAAERVRTVRATVRARGERERMRSREYEAFPDTHLRHRLLLF